ncbi:MAG: DMT family transporter [Streptosporangiales bacterium]|nr:DMT family transporter [Streptosporangiales bacterium]
MRAALELCVLAALVAVCLNATAAVIQADVTHQVPGRSALEMRLLADLVRRPFWLLGTGAAAVAFLFQVTALWFGPLVLVQPILVTSLLVTVALRALFARRVPRASVVLGAVVCAGGLSLFLGLAHPHGGDRAITASDVVPLAPILGGILVLSLLGAVGRGGNARAVPLAVAAGILYGVNAGLVKLVTRQLGESVLEPTRHWELYLALACGLLGVQLNQAAFQAGTVPAAVAVITVTDPITSVAVGLVWLGERVDMNAFVLAFEAFGFAAMVVGIVLLAREAHDPIWRRSMPWRTVDLSTRGGAVR